MGQLAQEPPGRCEMTPPIDSTITGGKKTQNLGDAKSPILPRLSKPRGLGRMKQPLTSTNSGSAHTMIHDPVVATDQPPKASIEDGTEELHRQRIPFANTPTHIPVTHDVESSKKESNVGHSLITPPPSSTPADLGATKPRGPRAFRASTTSKQATSYKRSLRGRLSDEEKIMINTLPTELQTFARKEMYLSNAAADSDLLLTLPRPKHVYVNGRQRLMFNDSRFTSSGKRRIDASDIRSAGIPSKKPYAPYSPPVAVERANLDSSKDFVFHKTANNTSQEEAFHARPSVKLIIPDVLKALLVDDWENVTKNTQLVPLPHPKPVTKILEDYSAYEMPKRPAGSSHADILEETLAGLKEYFDKSLGRILLYKFERPQYAEIHKKWNSTDPEFQGKAASDIYGAEHLCRLIVSLPELLAQTNMDQQSVNRLREELAKFCTWLSKNATEYFASSYETPAQDYVDKAKN